MKSSTKATQGEESNADICQCPKCLEVQERSEVCIKCGLIFEKYHKTELMKNSAHLDTITDDNVERMNPELEKLMNKSAFVYILAAALVSIFGVGNFEVSKYFCDLVKTLVPSLYGTSMISKDPNNTCLILALSWTWSIVTIGLVISWLVKQPVKASVRLLPPRKLPIKLLSVPLGIVIWAEIYFNVLTDPEPLLVYNLLKNWAFGSVLWGLMIFYTSVLVLILIMSTTLEIVFKFTSEKH